MALTLLNHFYWQIPEAKVPFMIADVVIVVAMRYVEKGIAAEHKLRHMEELQKEHAHNMDKGEKLAQKRATRQHNQQQQQISKHNKGGGNGRNQKINNIQQPSKRD